ncbi:MAG: farnesyl diphosphate synthase [Candidatus Cloacimonadota bacterium]|nr:farnesyl diphosphate synthase [Candidatus Cloacimonadota bacterium]
MLEMKKLKKDIKSKREYVNIYLDRYLPRKDEYPKQIHKSLRYTLFAGGKRLRPYLTIETYKLFKDDYEFVIPAAAALEILHTYTLIHDDLPEIDDDDTRRGRKANHILFGSDLALLAGDSLLVNAFQLLTEVEIYSLKQKKHLITELAKVAGAKGLIGGQMMDIISEGKTPTEKKLKFIHENKTAKLIRLSIQYGLYLAKAKEEDEKRMIKFGDKLGLAFQIVDDILDIEGSKAQLGKTIGKDAEVAKITFPAVYGLEKSREMAKKLIEECKELLSVYKEKSYMLRLLSDFVYERKF